MFGELSRRVVVRVALSTVVTASFGIASGPRMLEAQGVQPRPLTDLGGEQYLNRFEGGLYPGRVNVPPDDHLRAGLERAARVQPLDAAGRPDPYGKYVLLSIGMSNTSLEFCGPAGRGCTASSFVGQARTDSRVNRRELVIVDGAIASYTARDWDDPADPGYELVDRRRLARQGVSELQVQVVWLKVTNRRPSSSLPGAGADAYDLERSLGRIIRALHARYSNLQLIFISSRTYGGYSSSRLNPEPFAYETGFAVKWVVEAQIHQERTGTEDPEAGDLALTRNPWIGWGPYLWAAGENLRRDGLTWSPADVRTDGVHPSDLGVRKVGRLLLDFFATAPVSRCWFLVEETCSPPSMVGMVLASPPCPQ